MHVSLDLTVFYLVAHGSIKYFVIYYLPPKVRVKIEANVQVFVVAYLDLINIWSWIVILEFVWANCTVFRVNFYSNPFCIISQRDTNWFVYVILALFNITKFCAQICPNISLKNIWCITLIIIMRASLISKARICDNWLSSTNSIIGNVFINRFWTASAD